MSELRSCLPKPLRRRQGQKTEDRKANWLSGYLGFTEKVYLSNKAMIFVMRRGRMSEHTTK